MRQRSGGAVAFVLDSAAWTGGPSRVDTRLGRLRDAGWTALAAPPGVAFGDLWRQAGNAPLGTATSGGWG